MTEKEHRVERERIYVRQSECKLSQAHRDLKHGEQKARAALDSAKAEYDREYDRLKHEVERTGLEVEVCKRLLAEAEDEAERGFDTR